MDTKYFKTPFAASGDKNAVPNAAPVDGSVSYESGFGVDYQLDPATDPSAKDILRPDHNGILHAVTDSVRALQEFFAPQWISAADNGGAPFAYAAKALVLYTDGQVWQSLIPANTATPGTDATKWIVFQSNNASSAALAAEIARAEGAEGDLAGALGDEAAARAAADLLRAPLSAFVAVFGDAGSVAIPVVVGGVARTFYVKWAVGPWDPADNSEPYHFIPWALAFPNACLAAMVSTEIAAQSTQIDQTYQWYGKAAAGVYVQRQRYAGDYTVQTRAWVFGVGW